MAFLDEIGLIRVFRKLKDYVVNRTNSATAVSIIASTPNGYRRAELMTPNQTYITVHANTQVNINGNGYVSTEDVDLQLDDVLDAASRAGTDMYVYACQPEDEDSSEPVFVLSSNSTVPDGYDADNSRKIGGFHCLCVDVGTISNHTLSDYVAGDILPLSVWDLLHRANCENEGMVWIEQVGAWVDIYLASYDGEGLVSEYGGSTVTGTTGGKVMHAEMMTEYFGLAKKRNIWRGEFVVFAKGSNELTNISGSASPGTTGGHKDTASRRMISNYGVEDCCGAYWQWTGDMFGVGSSGAMARSSGNLYATNCGWVDIARESTIDGSTSYGQWYGCVARFGVGAYWDGGSYCGSRAVIVRDFSSRVRSVHAGRGAAGPRVVTAL